MRQFDEIELTILRKLIGRLTGNMVEKEFGMSDAEDKILDKIYHALDNRGLEVHDLNVREEQDGLSETQRELQNKLKEKFIKENSMAVFPKPAGTRDEDFRGRVMASSWLRGSTLPDKMRGIPHIAVPDEMIEGIFKPERIMYSDNVTICFWADGTKTVVKTNDEPFVKEHGVAMAIVKHLYGSRSQFLKAVDNGYDAEEKKKE